jgi:NOL1/NOP2/fmu family ribosome biogenesis protein
MSGTLVGEYRSNILIPSHQLFTVHGKLFKRQVELSEHTDLSEKYLLGEEIDAPDTDMRGYAAILFRGAPLGGGKISNGKIKNHYPKGLRNKK